MDITCRSAPVKPIVPLATSFKSLSFTLPIKGDFAISAFRIEKRSFSLGMGQCKSLSILPGLKRAGSTRSGLEVAAKTKIP